VDNASNAACACLRLITGLVSKVLNSE